MSKAKSDHSAAQPAAGYLYQARLALAECLRFAYSDSSVEIAIEKLDDVSFAKDGAALELLQTKHHLKKVGDLSDGSVDLWKTLRVWAQAVKADPSLPGRTRFALVTTAKAPTGSAAELLRPPDYGSPRDSEAAEAMLLKAAASSKNASLEKAVVEFIELSPAIRKELVASIEILDEAPHLFDLGPIIESRLKMIAPRGKAALAREQLEGWWWPRVCDTLRSEIPTTISIVEVEQKLDDIRDGLKRDALPLDMEHVEPSSEEMGTLDEMRFVKQLQSVGLGSVRMEYAKRDFYRASTQRSRWVRQNLLFDGEVAHFEQKLVEEWQPRYAKMCDELTSDCSKPKLRSAGQSLYGWVEAEARFPIRTQTARFLTVGSYHILAENIRVGWHRDFQTLHAEEIEGPEDA